MANTLNNHCSNEKNPNDQCRILSRNSNEFIQPEIECRIYEVKINENMFESYNNVEVNCFGCKNSSCPKTKPILHECINFEISTLIKDKEASIVILCFAHDDIGKIASLKIDEKILKYINGKCKDCYLWPLIYLAEGPTYNSELVGFDKKKMDSRIEELLKQLKLGIDSNVNLITFDDKDFNQEDCNKFFRIAGQTSMKIRKPSDDEIGKIEYLFLLKFPFILEI